MTILRNHFLVSLIERIGIRSIRLGRLSFRFSWTSWGYGVPIALDVEAGTRRIFRLFWWRDRHVHS